MATAPTTTFLPGVESFTSDGILGGFTVAITVTSVAPAEVGDDGGWLVTVTGVFPAQGVKVHVRDGASLDVQCYSGDVGSGAYDVSADGTTLEFVVPPLPEGGPYGLYFETEDGVSSLTVNAALTVVKRAYADNLYRFRGQFPPPRDVGPYFIADEDGA